MYTLTFITMRSTIFYVWVSWGFRAPHRLFKTLCVTNHKYTVLILILIVISVFQRNKKASLYSYYCPWLQTRNVSTIIHVYVQSNSSLRWDASLRYPQPLLSRCTDTCGRQWFSCTLNWDWPEEPYPSIWLRCDMQSWSVIRWPRR